jgi:heme exporter protein A
LSRDAAIEADGVTRRFGSRVAVDRVGLSIRRGESVALFGPNGAGKTTLLRVLSSSLRPTDGTVRVAGLDYREDPQAARRVIGVLSHSSHLYDDLPARDNLVFFASLYGVDDPGAAAGRWLEAMDLADRAEDPVKTFSRGMTQRLSLARSLVHDPEIVFMDEPFSGLDPRAAALLRNTILHLRERERTVIMVTHDIGQGLELSDRWILLARGRVRAEGPSPGQDPEELRATHFAPEPGR